jgi:DNA-directed RNA polymerase beta' subunit
MDKINIRKTKLLSLASKIKNIYPDLRGEIKIDNKNKKIYLKTNKKELSYEALKEIELEIKKFFVNYKIEILNY